MSSNEEYVFLKPHNRHGSAPGAAGAVPPPTTGRGREVSGVRRPAPRRCADRQRRRWVCGAGRAPGWDLPTALAEHL